MTGIGTTAEGVREAERRVIEAATAWVLNSKTCSDETGERWREYREDDEQAIHDAISDLIALAAARGAPGGGE